MLLFYKLQLCGPTIFPADDAALYKDIMTDLLVSPAVLAKIHETIRVLHPKMKARK